MKKVAIFIMIAAFSCGLFVLPAFAGDDSEERSWRGTGKGEAMFFDLVLLRPIGVASVAVGFAATIAALPFSIIANNTREVGDAMLTETMNYTFVRPLGEVFEPASMLDR
ncbi:MAG: hypothetical protein A4E60_00249 [Syntrophorhabdus sp. PtaB.Bin047]|jgi:hypothetical protein|nr:MAG: hypothetical protein A4E60_00249 [Syntrophorhabdus sp. PtaB.Bin047]